jgi:5-methylcytosine-specific restriction endonuclease McrA
MLFIKFVLNVRYLTIIRPMSNRKLKLMPICKICLRLYKELRYKSSRVCICGHCTNDLNKYHEVAQGSYDKVRAMLQRGIVRRANETLSQNLPAWQLAKAELTLLDPSPDVEAAYSGWVNRLVADTSNRTKLYKIIRAERRGLLHTDRPYRWGYPSNWQAVASRIRQLDDYKCVACGATDCQLHVHHIVYVSNFGTHQQSNLVTLCRSCHEAEHERVFDFGENMLNSDLLPSE